MTIKTPFLILVSLLFLSACSNSNTSEKAEKAETTHGHDGHHGHDHAAHASQLKDLRYEQEKHITNIKQLTFGGDNAEAYFSFDNKNLVFQASNDKWGAKCDQIFMMSVDGYEGDKAPLLSTGLGRTTCSYFMPDNKSIVYASTHKGNEACPDAPRSVNGKYVWAVFPDFDIYQADLEGNIIKQLTTEPGYDAEATVSPDGKKIVFTSTRSGDLELYTMDLDGSNVQQVTKELGYDGGAFFTPDSKQLIFRSSRPSTEEAKKTYKEFLAKDLVQPTNMELYICNVDGSDLRQITNLGGANWAPFMHPSGEKVLFCSNHKSKSGRQFNLFLINLDGTGLEQVTYDGAFDSFPMFSPDGKRLVFSSNRNNGGGRDTNVFIADWVD